MDKTTVTIELPSELYADLEALASEDQTDPVEVIAHLLTLAREQYATSENDPIFDLIGAYRSQKPLIDDIPVSEDPDLYLVAEDLGPEAGGKHAWEIAPARYTQGPGGRSMRRVAEKKPPQ